MKVRACGVVAVVCAAACTVGAGGSAGGGGGLGDGDGAQPTSGSGGAGPWTEEPSGGATTSTSPQSTDGPTPEPGESSGGSVGGSVSTSGLDESSDGDASTTTSGYEGPTATVAGIVFNGFVGSERVGGAQVSVWPDAEFTTVAGADGSFELDVPADSNIVLVAERAGHYGALRALEVAEDDVAGFDIRMFVEDDLDSLMPLVFPSFSAGSGLVVADAGALNVTIEGTLDGAALVAPGRHFTWGAGGSLLESNTTGWDEKPAVTFYNLGDHDAGALSIAAMRPMSPCTVPLDAELPVIPGYITQVDIECS